jgi:hypothetical protein
MLQSFPLLAVSLLLFTGSSLLSSDVQHPWYYANAFSIQMMSGDVWKISSGDLFLVFSMGLLFVEILRSTRSGGESIINHAFSVLVFVCALFLFLTKPGFGNSTFFIFLAMTLLDFLAGFIITAVTARRDIAIGRPGAD